MRRHFLPIAAAAALLPAQAVTQTAAPPIPGMPASEAQSISVTLGNFDFTPRTVRMPASTQIVLRLSNTGSGGHNFDAERFFAAATIAPEDAGKVAGGKVELDKGETIDLHVTTPPPGTYKLHCSHFMHTMFGMKGEIVVG